MRYADTVVGLNPTHVDYSDYREVSGVKLPFRWTVTWTDGQSTFEMKELQANVPIDAAKFAKTVRESLTKSPVGEAAWLH